MLLTGHSKGVDEPPTRPFAFCSLRRDYSAVPLASRARLTQNQPIHTPQPSGDGTASPLDELCRQVSFCNSPGNERALRPYCEAVAPRKRQCYRRFGLVALGVPFWALKYATHIGDSSMR